MRSRKGSTHSRWASFPPGENGSGYTEKCLICITKICFNPSQQWARWKLFFRLCKGLLCLHIISQLSIIFIKARNEDDAVIKTFFFVQHRAEANFFLIVLISKIASNPRRSSSAERLLPSPPSHHSLHVCLGFNEILKCFPCEEAPNGFYRNASEMCLLSLPNAATNP